MSIVWLASYPKSGNTWVRALLTNYLHTEQSPASINALLGNSIHLDRYLFDETMGIASAEMTDAEIASARPIFHEELAKQSSGKTFIKTHDAFGDPAPAAPLFPAASGCKAIYIIRNPLDIVPSFGHHQGQEPDAIIALMADTASKLPGGSGQFGEHLGTWADHVTGWTEQNVLETLIVRYEDLIADTVATFERIVRFTGLEVDIARVQRAAHNADFDTLRQNEQQETFREKRPSARSFFREGQAGTGRRTLTEAQIGRVVEKHRDLMFRFSYD